MAEAGWSDIRPNDHDTPHPLSWRRRCHICQHEEHALECEALIDPLVSATATCPCNDVPVPGIYVPIPRPGRVNDA